MCVWEYVRGHVLFHLISKGSQVSLKALMLALQGLNTGQVMAIVVSVKGLVFLLDPLLSLIRIP